MTNHKPCSVYVVTNLLNGHQYVGVSYTPYIRWEEHLYGARGKSKSLLCRAIRKYGKENFKFEVIQEFSTRKEALDEERRQIATLNPKCNLTSGGE